MEELNHTSTPSKPNDDQNQTEEPETMDMATAMEGQSWEEQLEESLSGTTLKRGELREGTILYRRNDGFVVDVGAKRDGFVPIDDIAELEGREFEVGDEVPVVVTNFRDSDGNVELSIAQALLQEDWLKAEKLLESQEVYEAKVTGSNRGGLTVEFGRLRGFVPMSQLIGFNRIRQPAERQRRLHSMVDEVIMLKVIEVNRRRRRLIMSQRAAAKEWRSARRENLLEELEAGQVRRGRVSQITDFGLFVNLGGMDGLVHISELSWGRIENPSEVFHTGQRIKVKVLNVDQERQRIALSIKALTPDPWESVVDRYNVGDLVEGRVTQVVDFGVFIELEPGVEGLLHNSELRDIAQREELSSGESILVKIIRIEPDRRRIGLSVRQVRPDEWEEWALAQIEEEQEATAEAEPEAEDLDEGDEDLYEEEEGDDSEADSDLEDEDVAEVTDDADEDDEGEAEAAEVVVDLEDENVAEVTDEDADEDDEGEAEAAEVVVDLEDENVAEVTDEDADEDDEGEAEAAEADGDLEDEDVAEVTDDAADEDDESEVEASEAVVEAAVADQPADAGSEDEPQG